MDVFLPKGFEPGSGKVRMSRPVRASELCVKAGSMIYPVLRRWAGGFVVSAMDVPVLEGVVDLYDGAEHLHQCLITCCEQDQGEMIFSVKQSSVMDYAVVSETGADDAAAVAR